MATPPHGPTPRHEAPGAASPTLPLPPPRAVQIELEEFFEVAAKAALRAIEAQQFEPQPGPGREPALLPSRRIWIGLIAEVALNPQPLPPRGTPGQGGGLVSG
jgi:hypothetical protein